MQTFSGVPHIILSILIRTVSINKKKKARAHTKGEITEPFLGKGLSPHQA